MKIFRNWYFLLLIALAVGPIACDDDDAPEPIKAEFAASTTTVLTGVEVEFTDLSTGPTTFWTWTFEGGTPAVSHLQHPVVVYTKAGVYLVKLVARNPDQINEVVKTAYMTVTETPLPITADFTSGKTSGLTGQAITFTDASLGNPSQWAWEFTRVGGAAPITSTEKAPDIVFTDAGLYTVKLTASNSAYSSTETKTDYINIIDINDAVAEFSADITLTYEGQQVTFADESVGTVTSWEWTFEGGTPATSTDQNPVVTYNTAGQHTVTLKVSNTTRSSTKELVDHITIIPGAGLATFLTFDGNGLDNGPYSLPVVNDGVTFAATDRHGMSNTASTFGGGSKMVISPSPDKQFGASGYSIGVWLKSGPNTTKMMIWEEGGGASTLPQAWFRLNDNTSTQIYRFNWNTTNIISVSNTVGTVLTDGNWHHVVCVRSSSGASIYVDGVKINQASSTPVSLDNEKGLILGAQYNESATGVITYTFPYSGALDDLVVYKRALTEAEITLLSSL